ncbi:MAG: hypothetical protein HY879_07205 [Deltaproteobacteria bacterium]|nr:hypothetical protein [Deltaproteobacteria bacterium]
MQEVALDCPKFRFHNISPIFCLGNDCANGIENCKREIHIKAPRSFAPGGADAPVGPESKNIEFKKLKSLNAHFPKSDNRENRLQLACVAEEHLGLLRVYADIVRRCHKKSPLNDQEVEVAKTIQRDIHNYYSKFQKNYLGACRKGDSRFYIVAVNALRPYCFKEHWFNKGVRLLEKHMKEVHTPSFKGEIDFSGACQEAAKIENKLKKKKTTEIKEDQIKRYYRGYPPKAETLILHRVFILVNTILHENYLDDFSPLDDKIYQELIQLCHEELQLNPSQPLFK